MHTVIVGGGLAGVKAALELSKRSLGKITLMTDEPYLLYHAALYRAVTGCDALASAVSLEDIFVAHHNVKIIHDHIESIDLSGRRVVGKNAEISYDSLIIATSSVANYFAAGKPGEHGFGTTMLDQARVFKRSVHDVVARHGDKDTTYVIVGAGLVGVELAGALGRYIRDIAKAHEISTPKTRVMLTEKEHRILPHLSTTASKKVGTQLNQLGVTVMTNHEIKVLTKDYVTVDSKKVPTNAIIWTCGSNANPFFERYPHEFTCAPDGRVIVNHYLEARDDIYVLGDSSSVPFANYVETALRQAVFVARHLERKMTGKPLRRYRPHSVGVGINVGKRWAYTEKYSIYSAGRLGYWLYCLGDYRRLRSLLTRDQALRVLRAGTVHDDDCDLCGT